MTMLFRSSQPKKPTSSIYSTVSRNSRNKVFHTPSRKRPALRNARNMPMESLLLLLSTLHCQDHKRPAPRCPPYYLPGSRTPPRRCWLRASSKKRMRRKSARREWGRMRTCKVSLRMAQKRRRMAISWQEDSRYRLRHGNNSIIDVPLMVYRSMASCVSFGQWWLMFFLQKDDFFILWPTNVYQV